MMQLKIYVYNATHIVLLALDREMMNVHHVRIHTSDLETLVKADVPQITIIQMVHQIMFVWIAEFV